MSQFRLQRLAVLTIAVATIAVIFPSIAGAAGCPPGYRTLTFTNRCSTDVYLGENVSSPQLQNTGSCTHDSDCGNGLACSGGSCFETCTTAADCGPNQVCYPTNMKNSPSSGTPTAINLCYFANFEPTVTGPAPSSGSAWQLPANGGQSQICIPEGPTSGSGGAAGAPCTKNSDCISNTCAGGSALNRLCMASDTNCKCSPVFTWGGNFWGRTECTGANTSTNSLTCQTANCGAANNSPGNLDCNPTPVLGGPYGQQNPAFLGEFTLEVPPNGSYNAGAQDFYDNSAVNGFNVGYSIVPVPGTFNPPYVSTSPKQCGPAGVAAADSSGNPQTQCPFDILSTCPSTLQYTDASGHVAGCWAPTQGCTSATSAQQAALGCTNQVPFLCQVDGDCPFNAGGTQTMTCGIAAGQAFGQCMCSSTSDCPSGYTCSSGQCVSSTPANSTWADLYGCVAGTVFKLSPYNSATTDKTATGIVCGCPSWSAPGECLADNINWEQVPVGSTSPVPSPAPTNSIGSYYLLFHNSCPTAYTYPYDDQAGTYGCTNTGGTTGPSYNITFCPAAAASATPTSTATPASTPTPTSTAALSPTPSVSPSPTASVTATPSPTSSPTPTRTASPSPTPSPSPTASVSATPSPTSSPTPTRTVSPTPSSSPSATPSKTPSPSPTALPSSTLAPTPTAVPPTATVAPSVVPTPAPTTIVGAVLSPAPIRISSGGGQTVSAGSFVYTNTTASAQQVGAIVVSASGPSALASLTVTVSGQTVTISPVKSSNTLSFNPPLAVSPGATLSFSFTAQTATNPVASIKRLAYAALVELGSADHPDDHGGGGPLAPLGGGLLMMGLILLPLGDRQRRRAALLAVFGLVLIATLAGCGSSSSSHPSSSSTSATVSSSGALSKPLPLSSVTVTSTSGSASSTQQLTALIFK